MPRTRQCAKCRYQATPIGGTLFHKVKLPLLCSAVSQVHSQAMVHNGDLDIRSDGDVPDNVASITHITGSLNVGGIGLELSNPSLTTLHAIFPALTTVGRSLEVIFNHYLNAFSGFDVLQSIGDDLFITWNKALISILEFSMLKRIVGNFKIGNPIFWGLQGNRLLTDISDFDMLEHVGGDFSMYSNSALTSITQFASLNYAGGRYKFMVMII